MKKTRDDIGKSKYQQRNALITVKKTKDDSVKAMRVHAIPKEVMKTKDDSEKAMSAHSIPKEAKKVVEPDVFYRTVVASVKKSAPVSKPLKRIIMREEYEV